MPTAQALTELVRQAVSEAGPDGRLRIGQGLPDREREMQAAYEQLADARLGQPAGEAWAQGPAALQNLHADNDRSHSGRERPVPSQWKRWPPPGVLRVPMVPRSSRRAARRLREPSRRAPRGRVSGPAVIDHGLLRALRERGQRWQTIPLALLATASSTA